MKVSFMSAPFAAVLCLLFSGCMAYGLQPDDAQGASQPAPADVQRTTIFVNDTLASSAHVCAALCLGPLDLQETPLALTDTTVTRIDYHLTWDDAPPLCQHLRFQIYYEQENSWGGIGRELVFTGGPSPITGHIADMTFPLNDTLSFLVVVAIRDNPANSPAFWFAGAEQEYSLRLDLEHRATIPGDADWLNDPIEETERPLMPSPYAPVCT